MKLTREQLLQGIEEANTQIAEAERQKAELMQQLNYQVGQRDGVIGFLVTRRAEFQDKIKALDEPLKVEEPEASEPPKAEEPDAAEAPPMPEPPVKLASRRAGR